MAIWQTERDICYMYRHAFKQAEQIQILAELNNCSEEEIRKVLKRNGIKPAEIRRDRTFRTQKSKPWTVEELVQFLYLDSNGMTTRKLSQYFKRSEHAIGCIRSILNTKQTEAARAALEIFSREKKRGKV